MPRLAHVSPSPAARPTSESVVRQVTAGPDDASGHLLDGYVEMLTAASADGRRLTRTERDSRRALGAAAAQEGVPLAALADLYLRATLVAWKQLPRPGNGSMNDALTATVLQAVNDAISAMADGYESAQREAIREEEAARRELIEDLLNGIGDLGRIPERASRFGWQLTGVHTVTVAQVTFPDEPSVRRLETRLLDRLATHNVLVAGKDGLLVCVSSSTDPEVPEQFARQVLEAGKAACPAPGEAGRRAGIGRAHCGPAGVARSYAEAREALDLAERLDLPEPIVRATDLLVYQVLLRDREAITDLVETVLGPLRGSRVGAGPLIDTLIGYFRAGNAVAAAQRLHIAVRTLTYRLERIRQLTGYSPGDPTHRFTLEAAALGARLLAWPADQNREDP